MLVVTIQAQCWSGLKSEAAICDDILERLKKKSSFSTSARQMGYANCEFSQSNLKSFALVTFFVKLVLVLVIDKVAIT